MLVRGAVGFKPNKSIVSSKRQVEASSPQEKQMFVEQWGGRKQHTDSLPSYVQEAFIEAFRRDIKEQQNAE